MAYYISMLIISHTGMNGVLSLSETYVEFFRRLFTNILLYLIVFDPQITAGNSYNIYGGK